MSQIAAPTPNAAAEAPQPGHGEMLANPSADPSSRSARDSAAAPAAPARMAAQDTPERPASSAARLSTTSPSSMTAAMRPMTASAMIIFLTTQCQMRARRMMIGIGTPSSHSRIPRPMLVLLVFREV
jgi:hypothetical protein